MIFSKVIRCISSARKAPAVLIVALTLIATGCSRQEVDYRAADVQLAQTVRAQLDASADTKGAASRVVIEAKDGTVTLTGTVDTVRDKATVEQVVARVNGRIVMPLSEAAKSLHVKNERNTIRNSILKAAGPMKSLKIAVYAALTAQNRPLAHCGSGERALMNR